MLAGSKTDVLVSSSCEGRPFTGRRAFSIRANYPLRMHRPVFAEYLAVAGEGDATAPQKCDTKRSRPFHEFRMQPGAPQSDAETPGELSFDTGQIIRIAKPNATERSCFIKADADAQRF